LVRKFLSLRATYTPEELQVPFSVPRSRFDWQRMDAVLGKEASGELKLMQAMKLLDISPEEYNAMKRISAPAQHADVPTATDEQAEQAGAEPLTASAPAQEGGLLQQAAALGGIVNGEPQPPEEPPAEEHKAPTFIDYTEGVLDYRKWSDGRVQLSVFNELRNASEQLGSGLNNHQKELVLKLFNGNRPEFTNHLQKHFGVKTGAALTWEQLAALLKWKQDGRPDMRWYADKIKEAEVKTADANERNKVAAFYGIDPLTLTAEEPKAFLDAVMALPDPKCLLTVMTAYTATWEKCHEALTSLAQVLKDGKAALDSPEFKELCEISFVEF
jgi:hypothetical protein